MLKLTAAVDSIWDCHCLGQRVAAAAAAVSAIAAMACFSKVSDVITSPGDVDR